MPSRLESNVEGAAETGGRPVEGVVEPADDGAEASGKAALDGARRLPLAALSGQASDDSLDPELRLAVAHDPLPGLLRLGVDHHAAVVRLPHGAADHDLLPGHAHAAELD